MRAALSGASRGEHAATSLAVHASQENRMLRVPTLAAAAVLAACHSSPPLPKALTVRNPFAVAYAGRVSPLSADDAPEPAEPAPESALAPRRVVAFRATWLELPVDEAHQLLPALTTQEAPAGFGGGHVEPAMLREALAGLADRSQVCHTQRATIGVGDTARVSTLSQRAFVKSLRLARAADSLLVDDLEVGVFEYGSSVDLAVAAQGDGLCIGVEWSEVTPVLPIPFTNAPMASVQVPVLRRHTLTASISVTGSDGFVLASLPADAVDAVRILCVEVEPWGPLAAR
jgi:hypothetical protein